MKMSIGEVANGFTILRLKKERTDLNVDRELELYKKELKEEYKAYENIVLNINLKILEDINGKIWDLESDIRKGKEDELGLKEVGKRALRIRNLNSQRIEIKNSLNKYFEEGFEEIKKDHASEK